jgi:hypothetical protein
MNGGIQTQRAGGLRSEVSPDLVHEVSVQGVAGARGGAGARPIRQIGESRDMVIIRSGLAARLREHEPCAFQMVAKCL